MKKFKVIQAKIWLTIFLGVLMVTGGSLFFYKNVVGKETLCKKVNLELLKKHLPGQIPANIKIVSKREFPGICEVVLKLGENFFPVYVGKDFVIAGRMFSHKNFVTWDVIKKLMKQQEKKYEKKFTELKSEVDKLVVIKYKPSSHPKHVVYMFTDPVCPFCHRAEQYIKDVIKKNNAELRILFFPVHRPIGEEKAIEAICKKMDIDTYLSDEWRKEKKEVVKKYQCSRGKEILKKSEEIAGKLGIRAVPTFILENGKRMVGANIKKLNEMLR